MNKRSAIVAALGLTAALVIGGAAFAIGLTGPTASLAAETTPAAVRTVRTTVTIHRPSTSAPVVGVTPSAADDAWDDRGDDGGDHGSDDDGEDRGDSGHHEGPDDDHGRDDHGDGDEDGPDHDRDDDHGGSDHGDEDDD